MKRINLARWPCSAVISTYINDPYREVGVQAILLFEVKHAKKEVIRQFMCAHRERIRATCKLVTL